MFDSLQPLPLVLAVALAFATAGDDPPPPPPPPPSSSLSPPPPPPPPPAGYDPNAVMRDATLGRAEPPIYPPEENCRGVGGEALLLLDYDRHGAVVDARIVRSSGNRNLDRAAVNSAKRWTVNPATRDGLPIDGQATVTVKFEPNSDPDCRRPQIDMEAAPGRIAPTDTPALRLHFAPRRSSGAPLEVRWSRHGDGGAEVLHRTEQAAPVLPESLVFEWQHDRPLAPGSYSVELRQSQDVLAYLMFEVAQP